MNYFLAWIKGKEISIFFCKSEILRYSCTRISGIINLSTESLKIETPGKLIYRELPVIKAKYKERR